MLIGLFVLGLDLCVLLEGLAVVAAKEFTCGSSATHKRRLQIADTTFIRCHGGKGAVVILMSL